MKTIKKILIIVIVILLIILWFYSRNYKYSRVESDEYIEQDETNNQNIELNGIKKVNETVVVEFK